MNLVNSVRDHGAIFILQPDFDRNSYATFPDYNNEAMQ